MTHDKTEHENDEFIAEASNKPQSRRRSCSPPSATRPISKVGLRQIWRKQRQGGGGGGGGGGWRRTLGRLSQLLLHIKGDPERRSSSLQMAMSSLLGA